MLKVGYYAVLLELSVHSLHFFHTRQAHCAPNLVAANTSELGQVQSS